MEAVKMAGEIGFPVVLKLVSPDFSHKSDIGGVALNLLNANEVEKSCNKILEKIMKDKPQAKIDGILVHKMLENGQEIIVGFRRDLQFGPLVVVGSGGIHVELLKDIAMGIGPITPSQAEGMLDSTLAGVRLKGWRGLPPKDRDAVLDAIFRISQISLDFPEILELEINPLYVMTENQGAFAIDVRGVIEN